MSPNTTEPQRDSAWNRFFMKVAFGLTVFFSLTLFASATTILDTEYKPTLAGRASVNGVIALSNGKVIVFGDGVSMNGGAADGIARLNADGSLDTTFHLAPELIINKTYAVAVQSDGKILIGGEIAWYGYSGSQNYLFRLNADGSWDNSLDAGGYVWGSNSSYGLNGIVRTILVEPGGKIVVGGDFTYPYNHITRLNTDGTVDATFDPVGGANGVVTHVARQSSGHLIIGGGFTAVGGVTKGGIARLTSTGAVDATAFGPGVSGGGLSALAVQDDNRVLIGGRFTMAGGVSAPKMARFSDIGEIESAFTPFVRGYLDEVTSLLPLAGSIIVGGWYPVMYFNGYPTDHNAQVYALSVDGAFVNYVAFSGKPTDVWGLALRSDGTVVAVGSFTQRDDPIDTGIYAGVCLLSGTNFQLDPTYRPIAGAIPDVRSLALQADGRILVAGDFWLVDGVPQSKLTRLNTNGTLDASLTPPATVGGPINAVLSRSDGKIIIGGSFYRIANVDYRDVALLGPSGTVEAGAYVWNATALAWYPGDKIVVGSYNKPGIHRLNANLSVDDTFNPGGGISNAQQPDYEFDRVNAVAVQPDGNILVAGSFSTFAGETRQNIVRLNANGSLDSSFHSPSFTVFNFRSEIFSIAVQADGKILIAGRFSSVDAISRPTVARLNADGTVDTRFVTPFLDQGSSAYSAVYLQPDGRVLVGGDIQLIEGGSIFNGIVRLLPNGARDNSFNSSAAGAINAILVTSPVAGVYNTFAGGAFGVIDSAWRFGIAKLVDSKAMYAITTTASPTVAGAVVCDPNPVSIGENSTCTATTNAGYLFAGWVGGCATQGRGTCALTAITSAPTVTANFVDINLVLPARGGWRAVLGR
ncbi:hypothetical protein [uncultured Thiodictyon sp.]|uniref:InlB B-repeat-containing protein n=1 Tax=uncultured Thiodictyon sp. TaxID=1846217 RepID=UPI0025CFFCFD|nr:hypothetical protein [uncultured Thiodictyon sp.]